MSVHENGYLRDPPPPLRGWILYDGSCGMCSHLREKWGPTVEARGFRLARLGERWVQERLGLHGEIPEEVKLLTPDDRILGGVDAFIHIARFVWWGWPLWLIGQIPLMPRALSVIYRLIARHRHGISRACGLNPAGNAEAVEKWLE